MQSLYLIYIDAGKIQYLAASMWLTLLKLVHWCIVSKQEIRKLNLRRPVLYMSILGIDGHPQSFHSAGHLVRLWGWGVGEWEMYLNKALNSLLVQHSWERGCASVNWWNIMAFSIWSIAEEKPQKWKLGGYHSQLRLLQDSFKNISEFTELNLLAQPSVPQYFVLFPIFIISRRIVEGDIDLMNWKYWTYFVHPQIKCQSSQCEKFLYIEKLSNYLNSTLSTLVRT